MATSYGARATCQVSHFAAMCCGHSHRACSRFRKRHFELFVCFRWERISFWARKDEAGPTSASRLSGSDVFKFLQPNIIMEDEFRGGVAKLRRYQMGLTKQQVAYCQISSANDLSL